MSTKHAWLILLVPATAALGCQPNLERVNITPVTTPPLAVVLTGTNIQIPDGIAVAADVEGVDEDGDTHTDLSASAAYSSFGVLETDQEGRFVFYGGTPSTGVITFTALGTKGDVRVPFTVTAQP